MKDKRYVEELYTIIKRAEDIVKTVKDLLYTKDEEEEEGLFLDKLPFELRGIKKSYDIANEIFLIGEKSESEKALSPCPFCGSKDVRIHSFYPKSETAYAYCGWCGASTHVQESEEEAVEAWNRRHKGYEGMPIPPGYTIRELIESSAFKDVESAAKAMNMMDVDRFKRLLTGECPVTEEEAYALQNEFALTAQFWLNLERLFRHELWAYWNATSGELVNEETDEQ